MRWHYPPHDVTFGDPGVNGYVRLTRAYRSLSRPSSDTKPRHPPYSVGVWTLIRHEFRQSRNPYVPFPVQTLELLKPAGYVSRRSSTFTPPGSPIGAISLCLLHKYNSRPNYNVPYERTSQLTCIKQKAITLTSKGKPHSSYLFPRIIN